MFDDDHRLARMERKLDMLLRLNNLELQKDDTIMTELDIITAADAADTATLVAKTDVLIAAFTNLSSANNIRLQAALDAGNLDASTQAAILAANDKALNDEIAKVNAVLPAADPVVDPAPVVQPDPTPVAVDPAPVDPAPVDPAPVDPAPVDPAPVDPAPPAS